MVKNPQSTEQIFSLVNMECVSSLKHADSGILHFGLLNFCILSVICHSEQNTMCITNWMYLDPQLEAPNLLHPLRSKNHPMTGPDLQNAAY
jgi:hypothetical protein